MSSSSPGAADEDVARRAVRVRDGEEFVVADAADQDAALGRAPDDVVERAAGDVLEIEDPDFDPFKLQDSEVDGLLTEVDLDPCGRIAFRMVEDARSEVDGVAPTVLVAAPVDAQSVNRRARNGEPVGLGGPDDVLYRKQVVRPAEAVLRDGRLERVQIVRIGDVDDDARRRVGMVGDHEIMVEGRPVDRTVGMALGEGDRHGARHRVVLDDRQRQRPIGAPRLLEVPKPLIVGDRIGGSAFRAEGEVAQLVEMGPGETSGQECNSFLQSDVSDAFAMKPSRRARILRSSSRQRGRFCLP